MSAAVPALPPGGGHGLAVRWSLRGAPDDVEAELRAQLAATAAGAQGPPGTGVAVWRLLPGEWVEGTYVWAGADERDAFAAGVRQSVDDAPVSLLLGHGPELVEPFAVVAVVGGA